MQTEAVYPEPKPETIRALLNFIENPTRQTGAELFLCVESRDMVGCWGKVCTTTCCMSLGRQLCRYGTLTNALNVTSMGAGIAPCLEQALEIVAILREHNIKVEREKE